MTTLSDCDDITTFDGTRVRKKPPSGHFAQTFHLMTLSLCYKTWVGQYLVELVPLLQDEPDEGGGPVHTRVRRHLLLALSRLLQLIIPYKAVFWIHDILVWIQIRIRGSMPLTNGSGSCYFRH